MGSSLYPVNQRARQHQPEPAPEQNQETQTKGATTREVEDLGDDIRVDTHVHMHDMAVASAIG